MLNHRIKITTEKFFDDLNLIITVAIHVDTLKIVLIHSYNFLSSPTHMHAAGLTASSESQTPDSTGGCSVITVSSQTTTGA